MCSPEEYCFNYEDCKQDLYTLEKNTASLISRIEDVIASYKNKEDSFLFDIVMERLEREVQRNDCAIYSRHR